MYDIHDAKERLYLSCTFSMTQNDFSNFVPLGIIRVLISSFQNPTLKNDNNFYVIRFIGVYNYLNVKCKFESTKPN